MFLKNSWMFLKLGVLSITLCTPSNYIQWYLKSALLNAGWGVFEGVNITAYSGGGGGGFRFYTLFPLLCEK